MAQRPVASTVSNAVELGLNLLTGVEWKLSLRSTIVSRFPGCMTRARTMGFRTVVGREISECPDRRPTTLLRQPVYGGSGERCTHRPQDVADRIAAFKPSPSVRGSGTPVGSVAV
jgi:hypothetical protein